MQTKPQSQQKVFLKQKAEADCLKCAQETPYSQLGSAAKDFSSKSVAFPRNKGLYLGHNICSKLQPGSQPYSKFVFLN